MESVSGRAAKLWRFALQRMALYLGVVRSSFNMRIAALVIPRLRSRTALLLLPVMVGFSLLQGWSTQAAYGGADARLWVAFMTGAIGAWCGLPIVHLAVVNTPVPTRWSGRFVIVHALAYAGFAVLSKLVQHITALAASSWLDIAFPFSGFWSGVLFDLQTSLPVYAAASFIMRAYELAEREREGKVSAARLELELAEAQHRSLAERLGRAQLERSLEVLQLRMVEDVPAAEHFLQQLGQDLRAAVSDSSQRTPTPAAVGGAAPLPKPTRSLQRLRFPRIERGCAGLSLAACALSGLIGGAGLHAALPAQAATFYALAFVRTVSLWILLPIPYATVASQRDPRSGWLRWMMLHVIGLSIFVSTLVGLEYGIGLLYIELAQLPVAAPPLSAAFLIEFQYATNAYVASAAVWTVLAFWSAQRTRAQRAQELAGKLSATRLAGLTAQLEPHFLLNALNTISELMHSDLPLATRLLANLRQLLESVLDDQRATWTLAEERDHTKRYVDFIEARFGDRISVHIALPRHLDALELPRFAIQGLVENAVKHNQDSRGPLRIEVLGRRAANHVSISVNDTGQGFSTPQSERKGGLVRLEQVLALLYGSSARLERIHAPGGAQISLSVPNGHHD